MALAPGTCLGPYEVVSVLGAGGMGEVYLAKDTRLDREVAIKVLPEMFSRDLERLQRFQREAKAISNLSHPSICTLYDVGQEDGVSYLVMEYLEGDTLAQRVARGPLPIEQVLRYGMEIASALDKAHRGGVIHRDLKPGNIMLTKSGAKLLDFGLAKHDPGLSALSSAPDAPTMTDPLTGKGTIVGTFQYMAPEQLEGRDADARTDIFAFGALLYEMATGKRAFTGKSRASLITSIMSARPQPISELQPMAPPAIDHLVRWCLAKDPDDRIQTAHDVKLQLQWIAEGGSQLGLPTAVVSRRKSRERLAWSLAAVLFVLAAGLSFSYLRLIREKPRIVRTEITAPPNARFDFAGLTAGPVVISPDGSTVAFVARGERGENSLWVRPLDRGTADRLPGTEGATRPFWSADSRAIGFFAKGKLKRVDASGGPPLTLCDAGNARGGTWNRDDVILFAPSFQAPIHRVSASGGIATPITEVDKSKHSSHRWPYFLPDGEHFLYLAVNHDRNLQEHDALYVGSLDGQVNELLMRTESNVAYASGYLLFIRDAALMAQPFDPQPRRFVGPAVPVADNVRYDRPSWVSVYSVSSNGTLVYQAGQAGPDTKLTWYDRTGQEQTSLAQEDVYYALSLSPDGKRLAVSAGETNANIWIYDLSRGMRTRLTFEPRWQVAPLWSPDGKSLAYSTIISDPKGIYRRSSLGVGSEETLLESEDSVVATDWSSDGKYLLYEKGDALQAGAAIELWALPADGPGEPFPVLRTTFAIGNAKFSPDGKWVAYSSNESGRNEIYVMPFVVPDQTGDSENAGSVTGKWQVSINGGSWPAWRRDGKELFYLSPSKELMVAAVDGAGEVFEVSSIESLFTASIYTFGRNYDVSADGQRIIANVYVAESNTPISLVQNWTAALDK